jgi:hypothetical protein
VPSTTAPNSAPILPVTFRLPKPGEPDKFFGFSRSFYYEGEQRGYWKLVRLRRKAGEGKDKSGKDKGTADVGVTLIPYEQVAAFVRGLIAEQTGGESNSAESSEKQREERKAKRAATEAK